MAIAAFERQYGAHAADLWEGVQTKHCLMRPGTPAAGCGATEILRVAIVHNAIRASSRHAVLREQKKTVRALTTLLVLSTHRVSLVSKKTVAKSAWPAEALSEAVQGYTLQSQRRNSAPCPSMPHPVAEHAWQRWHSARLPARARHQRATLLSQRTACDTEPHWRNCNGHQQEVGAADGAKRDACQAGSRLAALQMRTVPSSDAVANDWPSCAN